MAERDELPEMPMQFRASNPDQVCVLASDYERLRAAAESWRERVRELEEREGRLTLRLNHAVSELTHAAMTEDFDSDDCMDCVKLIEDEFSEMGKTTDWHTLVSWHDRLCVACGVDNEDEIDILPVVEQKLSALSAASRRERELLVEARDSLCGLYLYAAHTSECKKAESIMDRIDALSKDSGHGK